jgi:hypothetical protein
MIRTYFDLAGTTYEEETTISILKALGRPSEKIVVINDGADRMLAKAYGSKEVCISPNQTRVLHELPEKFVVINDGSNKLSLRIHSFNYPSKEVWIYPKHSRVFDGISKLLIAKTKIGNSYRVSEYTNIC